MRYVESFPADDKPGPGRLGRNRNFIKIHFWTGTRPPNSYFQAAQVDALKGLRGRFIKETNVEQCFSISRISHERERNEDLTD